MIKKTVCKSKKKKLILKKVVDYGYVDPLGYQLWSFFLGGIYALSSIFFTLDAIIPNMAEDLTVGRLQIYAWVQLIVLGFLALNWLFYGISHLDQRKVRYKEV